MATTPPPPTRVRTPPTPLHGPKYDSHEPYSPRRSGRLTNNRFQSNTSPSFSVSVTAATPRPKARQPQRTGSSAHSRPSLNRTASQTYSPPPSPGASPDARQKLGSARKAGKFGMHDQDEMQLASDHEGELLQPDSHASILPTPRKTPRNKRLAHGTDAPTATTARVLFPNRSNDLEEIMPSPRRNRKAGKRSGFTLESFADEAANGEEIPIYTDSKERVPDVDESVNNPFLSKTSSSGRGRQPKTKYGLSKEVDQAVDNNEGMVYVFRGKKFFRKFDDTTPIPSEAEPSTTSPEDQNGELQRRAGASAGRPFRRSRITPRKLFTEEIAQRRAEEGEDPEEMTTDVEGNTPSDNEHQPASNSLHAAHTDHKATTPTKQRFSQIATPPTTVHKHHAHAMPVVDGAGDGLPSPTGGARSPFDSWARNKSISKSAAKRQGEPLEKDDAETSTPKRTRNRISS